MRPCLCHRALALWRWPLGPEERNCRARRPVQAVCGVRCSGRTVYYVSGTKLGRGKALMNATEETRRPQPPAAPRAARAGVDDFRQGSRALRGCVGLATCTQLRGITSTGPMYLYLYYVLCGVRCALYTTNLGIHSTMYILCASQTMTWKTALSSPAANSPRSQRAVRSAEDLGTNPTIACTTYVCTRR